MSEAKKFTPGPNCQNIFWCGPNDKCIQAQILNGDMEIKETLGVKSGLEIGMTRCSNSQLLEAQKKAQKYLDSI